MPSHNIEGARNGERGMLSRDSGSVDTSSVSIRCICCPQLFPLDGRPLEAFAAQQHPREPVSKHVQLTIDELFFTDLGGVVGNSSFARPNSNEHARTQQLRMWEPGHTSWNTSQLASTSQGSCMRGRAASVTPGARLSCSGLSRRVLVIKTR